MNTNRIFGRKKEQEIFERYLAEEKSSFIAIYGRRRIGKTFLVDEYFGNHSNVALYLKYTGSKLSTAKQLKLFYLETKRHFRHHEKVLNLIDKTKQPKNWEEAFFILRDLLDAFSASNPQKKIILFFDELPWFDVSKSGFKNILDYTWNQYFESQKNIILVVAGSAAHWIIENIINGKGGLYQRVSEKIPLAPFSLKESKLYLENYRNIRLTNRSLIELYMVTGGVVKYLEHFQPSDSPWTYIAREFACRSGNFYDEFEDLYQEIFEKAQLHREIIKILFKNSQKQDDTGLSIKGMTRNQIAQQASLHTGGTLTKVLKELSQAGFISSMPGVSPKNVIIYRLTDLYSLFYLFWFHSSKTPPTNADEWLKIMAGQRFNIWSGYAFENIVLNNIEQLKQVLGIGALYTKSFSLTCRGKKKVKHGAEIDLIIERPDGHSNLVEIKYHKEAFKISSYYKKNIDRKISALVSLTKTSPLITFVTLEGLFINEYSRALNAQDITVEKLLS